MPSDAETVAPPAAKSSREARAEARQALEQSELSESHERGDAARGKGKAKAASKGGAKGSEGEDADGAGEERKRARKRPSEVLQDGFALGVQVWARWSGIKFSHGVISKLLTSSKWVLVTFDDGTSQWVTSRELVLDEEPTAAALAEGTEVIAAWEDDDNFYKGVIVGQTSSGKCRVRYEDWDEGLVLREGVRVLPEGFGKKKRPSTGGKEPGRGGEKGGATHERKEAHGSSADAMDATTHTSAANGAPSTAAPTALNATGPASLMRPPVCLSTFVRHARDQLYAADRPTFERMTQILARAGSLALPLAGDEAVEDEARNAFESELSGALAEHPILLAELRSVLTGGPGPVATDATAEAREVTAEGASGTSDVAGPVEDKAPDHRDDSVRAASGSCRTSEHVPEADVSSEEESQSRVETTAGSASNRGSQGKGVRELSKLLHDFGDGSMVGVEIGSKTRQRGSSAAVEATAPFATSGSNGVAVPLKKRPREI